MVVDLNTRLEAMKLNLPTALVQDLHRNHKYTSEADLAKEVLVMLSTSAAGTTDWENHLELKTDFKLRNLSNESLLSLMDYFVQVQTRIEKLVRWSSVPKTCRIESQFALVVGDILGAFHLSIIQMQKELKLHSRSSLIWLKCGLQRKVKDLECCEYCIDSGILKGLIQLLEWDGRWVCVYLKVLEPILSKTEELFTNQKAGKESVIYDLTLVGGLLESQLLRLVACAENLKLLGTNINIGEPFHLQLIKILSRTHPQIGEALLPIVLESDKPLSSKDWLLNDLQLGPPVKRNILLPRLESNKPIMILLSQGLEMMIGPLIEKADFAFNNELYHIIQIDKYLKQVFEFYLFMEAVPATLFYTFLEAFNEGDRVGVGYKLQQKMLLELGSRDYKLFENIELSFLSTTSDTQPLDIYNDILLDFLVNIY